MNEKNYVPAVAGYDLVDGVVNEAGETVELSYTPVIAWEVSSSSGEHTSNGWPIAIGISHPNAHSIIRTPGGKFYDLEGNDFADEATVLKHLQETSWR